VYVECITSQVLKDCEKLRMLKSQKCADASEEGKSIRSASDGETPVNKETSLSGSDFARIAQLATIANEIRVREFHRRIQCLLLAVPRPFGVGPEEGRVPKPLAAEACSGYASL
jgi:hypothetical protein